MLLFSNQENGEIEVSAIDPVSSMIAVKNDSLANIAKGVSDMLQRMINGL